MAVAEAFILLFIKWFSVDLWIMGSLSHWKIHRRPIFSCMTKAAKYLFQTLPTSDNEVLFNSSMLVIKLLVSEPLCLYSDRDHTDFYDLKWNEMKWNKDKSVSVVNSHVGCVMSISRIGVWCKWRLIWKEAWALVRLTWNDPIILFGHPFILNHVCQNVFQQILSENKSEDFEICCYL